jgi:hypothetical protein
LQKNYLRMKQTCILYAKRNENQGTVRLLVYLSLVNLFTHEKVVVHSFYL